MEETAAYLVQYGYWILFAWVLLDQLAAPVPAEPMLLLAGGLAGEGHLSLALCLVVVFLATAPANLLWFWLGRHHGNKVLTVLCRVSLEPDRCIDSTMGLFHRHGALSLLVAKFVPGLQTVAPPLAGLFGVSLPRFLLLNTAGTLLYALAYLLPGWFAHALVADIIRVLADFGALAGGSLLGLLAAWLGWKVLHRQMFLRELRGRRMTVLDLQQALASGGVQVADLRQRAEFNADPRTIPGAVRVPLDTFDEEVARLTQERPLVLFCT